MKRVAMFVDLLLCVRSDILPSESGLNAGQHEMSVQAKLFRELHPSLGMR